MTDFNALEHERTKMAPPNQKQAQQILARIAEDYRSALRAEQEFIEWERTHRTDGECDEFARRFFAWLKASEPYVSGHCMIEERFPELIDGLKSELRKVH